MQLKTILNRVQKFKSFVYGKARWEIINSQQCILIAIFPRRNSQAVCSGCRKPGSGYDTLRPREFEFVPLWGFPVLFIYVITGVGKACEGLNARKKLLVGSFVAIFAFTTTFLLKKLCALLL